MVQSQIYHQYGSLVNKKIFLICHGHGEQSFLESILNKYLQPEHYIPVKNHPLATIKLQHLQTQYLKVTTIIKRIVTQHVHALLL